MIVILETDMPTINPALKELLGWLGAFEGVQTRVYSYDGEMHSLTEVHLIGDTSAISVAALEALEGVAHVIHVTPRHPLIGRPRGGEVPSGFEYMGLSFEQDNMLLFPGLQGGGDQVYVEETMSAIASCGLHAAHLGWVEDDDAWLAPALDAAARCGMAVVAVGVRDAADIAAVRVAFDATHGEVGVLLQIEGRSQALLNAAGMQRAFPVLVRRDPNEELMEALDACERVARAGNRHIVLGLQGVRGEATEHRRANDFGSLPVLHRRSRLPVAIDASACVGARRLARDGLGDIHHATAQGIIAGANLVFVDVHPNLRDAPPGGERALSLGALPLFIQDALLVREAYLARLNSFEV